MSGQSLCFVYVVFFLVVLNLFFHADNCMQINNITVFGREGAWSISLLKLMALLMRKVIDLFTNEFPSHRMRSKIFEYLRCEIIKSVAN